MGSNAASEAEGIWNIFERIEKSVACKPIINIIIVTLNKTVYVFL